MSLSSLPIGMFDSGVGGLSIMQAVMHQLPHESIFYLGDTQRLPYGDCSPETILRYSLECGHFLKKQNIKLLVVACNTASNTVKVLEEALNIPVIGVVESTTKKAIKSTTNHQLAVLATEATIRSKTYEQSIQSFLPAAKILSIACPSFVPLIEEDLLTHPSTAITVRKYLKNLHDQIDTLVLGCTHYFYLKSIIQAEAGNRISLIDSTNSCAEHISQILKERILHTSNFHPPHHRFFVSGDPTKFRCLGEKLLNISINPLEKITW